MSADVISKDLKAVLRRLRLSPLLHTLPERLVLARQQKMPHQDFLLLVLGDEASRRESNAATDYAGGPSIPRAATDVSLISDTF